jgi:hypothetical protein
MKLSLFFLLFHITNQIHAAQYFDSGINYWNKEKRNISKENKSMNLLIKSKNKKQPLLKEDKFSWKKQLNPKNDEFFREGDYLPPKSFLELVRNPTDTNIKNWFALMDKKNELSLRLSGRIAQYLQKKGSKMKPESQKILIDQQKRLIQSQVASSTKDLRFRMYFDSKCPHCERMMKTMESLSQMGYFVELRQIDDDISKMKSVPLPIVRATPNELRDKDVKSVPLLFVGDLKNKIVYRLSGYQSVQSIFSSINSKKGIKVTK